MAQYIRGTCEEFCPSQEVKFRTQEHLLHFYELKPGQKYCPDKVVKAFARSAAGTKRPSKSDLRTIGSLKRTVKYLLSEILLDERKPFHFVYDFIFDRLRCVRQEIVIQNLDTASTISLLEPMILFLSYSSYRLCDESIYNFDPKICSQHLQECLKRILCAYDELDQCNTSGNHKAMKNRHFIEALNQIFNLGSTEALERSLNLPVHIRRDSLFSAARKSSLEYFRGNYYQVLVGIKQLPHILCAIGFMKMPEIRWRVLRCFSHAFNSKQLTVPLNWLKDLLLYSTENDVINDCKHYKIQIIEDKLKSAVRFSKVEFNSENTLVKCRKEFIPDKKLESIFIPDILLLWPTRG